jgi:hypothetical protein
MDMNGSHSLSDIVNYLIKSNLNVNAPFQKNADDIFGGVSYNPLGSGSAGNRSSDNNFEQTLMEESLRSRREQAEFTKQLYNEIVPVLKETMKARTENSSRDAALKNWAEAIRALTPLLTLMIQLRNRPQQPDPFTALINSTFSGFRIPPVPNPFQQAQGMIG